MNKKFRVTEYVVQACALLITLVLAQMAVLFMLACSCFALAWSMRQLHLCCACASTIGSAHSAHVVGVLVSHALCALCMETQFVVASHLK